MSKALRKPAFPILSFLIFILFVSSVSLATETPKGPDPNANPVLAGIIKLGSKLFYMGNKAGLDGWMIIKDGQVQFAYTTPGSQEALLGAMFGPNGENISADQVQALLTTNK